jgi:hypothetical protein
MHLTIVSSKFRLTIPLLVTVLLWGCGQGDDKDKKVAPTPAPAPAPAPAPKTTPPPAPPKAEPKPAAKAAVDPTTQGWTLLGKQQADFKSDRDQIKVGGQSEKRRYKELLVRVEGGGSIDLKEMIVVFGNDEQFRPSPSLASTGQTIDLPGETRFIKRVEFVHKTTAGKGKATIALYGR